MNLRKTNKPIGGYFGIELHKGYEKYPNYIALNTARNSFEYLLLAHKPEKVYMPKYTCDVMFEPLKKLNISYTIYGINEAMEMIDIINLKSSEMVLYTNYFGVKDTYCDHLSSIYGNKLIIDCSQAFYYDTDSDAHLVYSPRKFFGVPDGGYVKTNQHPKLHLEEDFSYSRTSHLIKRIDSSAEAGYEDYKINDASLIGQPIKKMSKLTHAILASVDYDEVRQIRRSNFMTLHKILGESNRIKLDIDSINTPMIYPYLVPKGEALYDKLIKNKVYTAKYWPNVIHSLKTGEYEHTLASNLLALPVDQRYNNQQMISIARLLV